ncbi:restriction endonuclease [Sphingobacterium sp.]|uniref:restriction endonuclease n=1 Tax=Sphingobacterium sp. TaxID=341027 RepID=UPI0031DCF0FF
MSDQKKKTENLDPSSILQIKHWNHMLNDIGSTYQDIKYAISEIENKYGVKLRANIEEFIHKEIINDKNKTEFYYNQPKWVEIFKNQKFDTFIEFKPVIDINKLIYNEEPKTYKRYEDYINFAYSIDNLFPKDNLIEKKPIIETIYDILPFESLPPENQIILLDESSRVKRIITDIYNDNDQIFTIHPHEFEDMVAELLRAQNFETEITKRTRDGGYDIIAVQSIGDFPIRFLIECKRYAKKRKVSVDIVRSFRDVVNTENANKGIIITSSYFSPDAEDYRARHSPYSLDFKDHDDVIKWVNKYVK